MSLLSKEKLREILTLCLDGYLPNAAESIDNNKHLHDIPSDFKVLPGWLEPWAQPWLCAFIDACVADHKEIRFGVIDLVNSLPNVARSFRNTVELPTPDAPLAEALLVDFLNAGVFGARWCFDLAFAASDLNASDS